MDIAILCGLSAALIIYLLLSSPQWIRAACARGLARAEGLEAQRLHRDRALSKWNMQLDVRPIQISKVVALPSRKVEDQ